MARKQLQRLLHQKGQYRQLPRKKLLRAKQKALSKPMTYVSTIEGKQQRSYSKGAQDTAHCQRTILGIT